MKYVYTEAITPEGWGIVGVFPATAVDEAKRDAESGRPIIDGSRLIVGQGGGWDSGATLDDEWMRRAVDALNREEAAQEMDLDV